MSFRARIVVFVFAILIAAAVLWKAAIKPRPAKQPLAELPAPVSVESRPALPLESAHKPLLPPAKVLKKSVPARKPAPHLQTTKAAPAAHVAPPAPNAPYTPPVEASTVPKEWSGSDTAINHSGQVVIRSDRQWIQFWAEHHPHEAAPDVDFSRQMVVGVFAGERPADAFSIKIMRVRQQAGALVIDYGEKIPPPGTFQTGVSVYPYDLKVIPKSTLPVKFNLIIAQ